MKALLATDFPIKTIRSSYVALVPLLTSIIIKSAAPNTIPILPNNAPVRFLAERPLDETGNSN